MMAECLHARNQQRPVYIADGGRDGNDLLRTAGCPPFPTEPGEIARLAREISG